MKTTIQAVGAIGEVVLDPSSLFTSQLGWWACSGLTGERPSYVSK